MKRNARARRLSIRVTAHEGIVVVAPVRMRAAAIARILERQRTWIEQTVADVSEASREAPLPAELVVAGEPLRVTLCADATACRHRPRVRRRENSLILCPGTLPGAVGSLRAWCRREAQRVLPTLVSTIAADRGFACGRVVVRDQRTRWGSCSRTGTISLNWRLLLMPTDVMHYLIIHELAHTRVMNHGPAFWRTVASACPDWAVAERWLRRNGRSLPL